MEYNLVFYSCAPSLMQLGDGIGKMVLTRHPVFNADDGLMMMMMMVMTMMMMMTYMVMTTMVMIMMS